jgi:hypothetical protein
MVGGVPNGHVRDCRQCPGCGTTTRDARKAVLDRCGSGAAAPSRQARAKKWTRRVRVEECSESIFTPDPVDASAKIHLMGQLSNPSEELERLLSELEDSSLSPLPRNPDVRAGHGGKGH